jgi:ubiquinone/menaquinone biosynthesis C-methylase UbiE/uncharacterized membrane protein YbhN (UPF0104 family)
VRLLLKIAVTATVFVLIFRQVEPHLILDRLQSLHWGPLSAAAILLGCQFLITAWRWKRLADHASSRRVRYGDLIRFLGMSNLYGQLLPSTVGGDLVRTGMLARRVGLGPATLSVLVDRVTGLAILLFLMVAVLPLLAWRIEQPALVAGLAAIGIAGCAAFLAFVFLPNRLTRWLPRSGAQARTFATQLREALVGRTLAPAVLAFGVLIHLGSITLVFLLGRAVDVPLGFLDCVMLVPPALLLAALPVSVAGWGVREGALAGGFALIGVPPAGVVTVSILYGLTAPAIGIVYGVVSPFLGGEMNISDTGAGQSKQNAVDREEVMRHYDRVAAQWDTAQVQDLNAAYLESRWRSLEPMLHDYAGSARAVELGVGTGAYMDRIAPLFGEILAVDFSRGMLDVLERKLRSLGRTNVKPVQHDVYHLDAIPDGTIDVALAIGLMENIDEPGRLFAEVARILRPAGAFIATTSNGRCPWYRLRGLLQGAQHCRTEHFLTETEVRRLSTVAGLTCDHVRYWGTVPGGLRSPLLVKWLASLEAPLSRTPLDHYLGGLAFRAVNGSGICR